MQTHHCPGTMMHSLVKQDPRPGTMIDARLGKCSRPGTIVNSLTKHLSNMAFLLAPVPARSFRRASRGHIPKHKLPVVVVKV